MVVSACQRRQDLKIINVCCCLYESAVSRRSKQKDVAFYNIGAYRGKLQKYMKVMIDSARSSHNKYCTARDYNLIPPVQHQHRTGKSTAMIRILKIKMRRVRT